MKIYNSFTQQKEDLDSKLIEAGKVKMYVCGPTVYDRGHLGHGRSAVAFDIVHRYLEYKGYDVTFVMNITDIDDKMIKRADERSISVKDLAAEITPRYMEDYKALGVKEADKYPHATQYIEAMIDLIKKLETDGYTYVLDDGVYYDVRTFKDYGLLAKQNLDELKAGARVDVKDQKRNSQDFVLWKFAKEDEPYEDYWESPWGRGRPGWHIECSAMTWKTLGDIFDIHGGGLDLKFPHHECEIAQSQGALGAKSFAKLWMHNGFINVDNEKMSKSLNNFFTLEEVFARYHPQVIRMFYLGTHYRSPINYSGESLNHARAALQRLHDFVASLKDDYENLPESVYELEGVHREIRSVDESSKIFEQFMDDDFNVPGALGYVFELIKDVNNLRNEERLTREDIDVLENFFLKIDSVLGVIFPAEKASIDREIEMLIQSRENARMEKNFKLADEIRDELNSRGITLEDTPHGVKWKRKL